MYSDEKQSGRASEPFFCEESYIKSFMQHVHTYPALLHCPATNSIRNGIRFPRDKWSLCHHKIQSLDSRHSAKSKRLMVVRREWWFQETAPALWLTFACLDLHIRAGLTRRRKCECIHDREQRAAKYGKVGSNCCEQQKWEHYLSTRFSKAIFHIR